MGFIHKTIYLFDERDISNLEMEGLSNSLSGELTRSLKLDDRIRPLIKQICEIGYKAGFESGATFGFTEGLKEGQVITYENYSELNRAYNGIYG